MKVPFSWLKEYLEFDLTPEELGAQMVKSGFEVEAIENLGNGIENVRTCRITKIERHPDADRLQMCSIDLGDEQTMIITAATNVFEGAIVPAALDGAWLYGGKRIFKSPLRGVMSNGMFCSGQELGIDDSVIAGAEVDGILILPQDTPIGRDIKEILGMNEVVLDISVTSNRPDCQSMIGIAREASAILGLPLKMPKMTYKTVDGASSDDVKVKVSAPDLCTHYYGAVVKNVKIEESPKWMRDRLRYVGIRSINTIVDITNYVLTEMGQPMHAFDLRYIGGGQINVRRAADGEKLVTLDEKEFELNDSHLVIADAEKAIGLAGIMGGLNSEIKQDTSDIMFEAARFARGNIRQSSRNLGQRSASSARFERGVDIGTVTCGMERALALVDELACGTIVKQKVCFESSPVQRREIKVSASKINAILGIQVPVDTMTSILRSLNVDVDVDGDLLTCVLPLQREDLENDADIAEEIVRIYGYEHIESRLPAPALHVDTDPALSKVDRLKSLLVGMGCFETVTYSFIEPSAYDKLNLSITDPRRNSVVLRNPISEDLSVMRTTMAHNVLSVAALNCNRKNFEFRLFECSRVFLPKELPLKENPLEENRLTVTVCGEKESFFTLKGILEEVTALFGAKFGLKESDQPYLHPGQSSQILVKGKNIGDFGLVHPTIAEKYEIDRPVYFAELNLDALLSLSVKTVKFAPLPKYQESQRDLAMTVAVGVKAGDMLKAIVREGGAILENASVFDVYQGAQIEEGYKSIAFSMTFRAPDRTLVDDEVNAAMNKIKSALENKFDAKIRQ